MRKLSGGLREISAERTLHNILPLARRFGVSRVTQITHLDRINIPVYASIRPSAAAGIVRVHNGKGVSDIEAKVGALLEAFEFQIAEPPRYDLITRTVTASEMQESVSHGFELSDLCVRFGTEVLRTEEIPCLEAEDVLNRRSVLVPAELVHLPYRNPIHRSIFGSSTNGLASGNTITEASIHAVCEVLERDVRSRLAVVDIATLVSAEDWPDDIAALRRKIEKAGLSLHLLYAVSAIGYPFFKAYISEKSAYAITAISAGYGLHPDPGIAASRAITEAAQSRLTYIHGGRDDTIARYDYLSQKPKQTESDLNRETLHYLANFNTEIRFSRISGGPAYKSLQKCWDDILSLLKLSGFNHLFRVNLTPSDMPFSVVRVIIPKMEYFNPELQRIGPRLSHLISTIKRGS